MTEEIFIVPAKDRARFWSKVDKTDECWLWLAGTFEGRYGNFCYQYQAYQAHRFSWMMTNGVLLPTQVLVCHKCDVGLCVRPFHLFTGTAQENMQDAVRKGRLHPALGSKRPTSRLTEQKVMEAKALKQQGWTYHNLSKKYGVSVGTLYPAITGYTWKHI